MEIQFFGANCVTLATKQVRIVIDDYLESLGSKSISKDGDVTLFTQGSPKRIVASRLNVDMPGEYEVSDISIYGISARAHTDESKKKNAIMYKILTNDLRILVTGHIYPDLSEKQLEEIGTIDILIIPVGGNGYTLDPVGAVQVAKKVEPKVVIPVHYEMSSISYEVPQQSLDMALKAFGKDSIDPVAKFKPKFSDLNQSLELVVVQS